MSILSKQINWSVEENLYWEILKELSMLSKIMSKVSITTTTTTTLLGEGLELSFYNYGATAGKTPVVDPSDVSQWNTFFNLPTNGNIFTSVSVTENVSVLDFLGNPTTVRLVVLYGGSNITLKTQLFGTVPNNGYLVTVEDKANCVVAGENNVFAFNSNLWYYSLPAMITAGNVCFAAGAQLSVFKLDNLQSIGTSSFAQRYTLKSLYMPKCINLGGSVLNNNVFNLTVIRTLTIPSSLMTCNGGNPDGDLQELITYSGIALTILDPNGNQLYP